MVGGRLLLLSIAVLSSLGVDHVFGGQLRRQNGVLDSIQSAAGGHTARTSSHAEDAVASSPVPTTATTSTAATVATIAGPWKNATWSSSSRVDATPPALGPQPISSVITITDSSSTQTDQSSSPSTGDDGDVSSTVPSSSGTLTADPVSSSAPTGVPPPAETPSSSTRASPPRIPPTRPEFVVPSSSDVGYTYGPADPAPGTTEPQTAPTPPPRPPPRPPPGAGPPKLSTIEIVEKTTESVDLGYGRTLSSEDSQPARTTFTTSTRHPNETWTDGPSAVSYCRASDMTVPPTSWSVVYTTTITWYGNPEDYTQPYPPISIPSATSSCVVPLVPPTLTVSFCSSTGTGTKYVTCGVTTTTESYSFGVQTSTPNPIIFLTTDKNPAVVFPTFRLPDYGVSQGPTTRGNHLRPTDEPPISTPAYDSKRPPQAVTDPAHRRPAPTPITIGVQPSAVVINGNTILDNPATPTQVVIIAGQTFTIDPTRVVGAGSTIDRPSMTGGVFVPAPTSTNLGGVPVVVVSSIAIVGGTSFTLGPTPTTAIVSSQTFTIGPSAVAAASRTMPLPTYPLPTEVVVAGGELITAIGRSVVVIQGTTYTYPAAASSPTGTTDTTTTTTTTTTIAIDDDTTITLGPGGATVGGTLTLGGPGAAPRDTQLAMVGGATLTKIGASLVVIAGTTYTVGPVAGDSTGPATPPATTTLVVAGHHVTVAPAGVQVGSSLTLAYPFGPSTVILPGATPGGGGGGPSATGIGGGDGDGDGGGGDKDEEDAAVGVRPWLLGVWVGLGVAVGVGIVV